jgi:predicted phosphodiesterase
MLVAVMSDVHGNCVAFDAVLADLRQRPADQVVCLGDMIQGGPQPTEVLARLRELACPVVLGNADAWVLTNETAEGETPEHMRAIREWSLARLSDDDRAFVAAFQPTVELPLGDDRTLLCFHGSPRSYDDVIFLDTPEEEFRRLLDPFAPAVLAGGHTHTQMIRRLGDTFFFNPGSVGVAVDQRQPWEHMRVDPWAEYAILSTEDGRTGLEFRRVPFDVEALLRVARASGMPRVETFTERYQPA